MFNTKKRYNCKAEFVMFFKCLIYAYFLNKKQAFFRPVPVSYKRGYYLKNQGLVFLKFMFLICGTLLYSNTRFHTLETCIKDPAFIRTSSLKFNLLNPRNNNPQTLTQGEALIHHVSRPPQNFQEFSTI